MKLSREGFGEQLEECRALLIDSLLWLRPESVPILFQLPDKTRVTMITSRRICLRNE
jgi:hypothetical protein